MQRNPDIQGKDRLTMPPTKISGQAAGAQTLVQPCNIAQVPPPTPTWKPPRASSGETADPILETVAELITETSPHLQEQNPSARTLMQRCLGHKSDIPHMAPSVGGTRFGQLLS